MPLDSKKLKEVQERLDEIRDAGTEASFAFKDMSKQIGQLAKNSGEFRESLILSGKAAKDLVKESNELAKFTTADLSNKKQAAKFDKVANEVAKKRAKIESQIRVLNVMKANATEKEAENITKTINILQDGVERSSMISDEFDNINKANKELNSSTKWMDTMEETLGSIPGIGPLISKPFKEASQAMRDAKLEGEKWYDVVGAGGEVLLKSFGPAAIIGMLIEAVDHTTEVQRNLEMSTHEAERLNSRFSDIAFNSGDSVMHQKNLHEALQGISKEMGVVRGISDDQVKNQVFLTKKMGLSEKSAAKFAKYQTATGKSSQETNKEIESATKNLAKETGIVFKLSDIFDDVANTNAGLKAAYGFNNELLAEQVVKTKQLGINMQQAENIAKGMLDFESSIESELKAELLTGKDINLEEARRLALMGKSSEAAAEILNQVGSSHDLAQMNVIQQEALAKAAGMERNELIASVKERENLKKLGEESIADALEAGISREKIAETMGQEALAAYDTNKASEDFQGMLTKIQMKLGEMLSADAGLGKIVRFFGDLLNNSWVLYGVIGSITALIAGGMISSIGKFIAKMAAFFVTQKTADATAIAAKLEQNALDTTATTLQAEKNALLTQQLTTEQAIVAAKMEQNAVSGTGNVLSAEENVMETTNVALKKSGNKQEKIGLGLALRNIAASGLQLVKNIGIAAMSAIQSLAAIPVVGWGLGLAAAGTIAALGYKYMSDGVIGPGGEMVVSGPKGSIQLDKDDSIIAGTDLGGKGKGKSDNKSINIQPIVAAINAQNAILNQIAAKSPVIEMGGNEVGQGINTAEREIQ